MIHENEGLRVGWKESLIMLKSVLVKEKDRVSLCLEFQVIGCMKVNLTESQKQLSKCWELTDVTDVCFEEE